ncbi:PilT/PilU family type 4a pilus ATPase [Nitrincola tapanii]|uniref:PilT/PilU family type 4a pilus ATPase n=1 Tax=Nitrincola tapanii TaxID=1708751 RepID=A0A5A9W4N9_9GAMM|nr:PilT/PilU family type 4a pilus ATPase [Nitrincola tapanii]KAA0875687.1 PilT/PilU family type 4a pilus ATPase [Nitrincola tapanii]
MLDLDRYLKLMVDKQASDLFLSSHALVQMKVQGVMRPLGEKQLSPSLVKEVAYGLMNPGQIADFEKEWEMNFAHEVEGVGRFRVNIYRQRGDVALVIRHIRSEIPSISELNLPSSLQDLVMERNGLILIVGATGSGKSTTLAAMLEHRNLSTSGHILTIEDPIEYLHSSKLSLINQREVGIDTHSFSNALKNAMREAPDVIMIGEIRDRETMEQAIRYSETGHLCLSTLHANNSNQALEHILNFFHETESRKLTMDLSLNLKAVVSLRLVRGLNDQFIPVTEVLVNTPYVSELVARGDFTRLRDVVENAGDGVMHSFDQSLLKLYQQGRISEAEALHNADSRNNMSLKIRLMANSVG